MLNVTIIISRNSDYMLNFFLIHPELYIVHETLFINEVDVFKLFKLM